MLPAQQGEEKEHLNYCQIRGEGAVVTYMSEELAEKSVSGMIYKEWGLSRSGIRECQEAMARNGAMQTTFNNFIGGSRFRVLVKGVLMRTICQNRGRGQIDSWKHFKTCYQVPDIAQWKGETKIKRILEVCERALTEQSNRLIASDVPYHDEGSESN